MEQQADEEDGGGRQAGSPEDPRAHLGKALGEVADHGNRHESEDDQPARVDPDIQPEDAADGDPRPAGAGRGVLRCPSRCFQGGEIGASMGTPLIVNLGGPL